MQRNREYDLLGRGCNWEFRVEVREAVDSN